MTHRLRSGDQHALDPANVHVAMERHFFYLLMPELTLH
jgi:hypothetical protein